MKFWIAAFLAPTAAIAQPAPEAAVRSYPSVFFQEMQLDTAYEMVLRVPGFVFNGADNARGYSGSIGNVLVDGRPPASKTDALGDYLNRIPARSVERIDVINGGAPGIDMQGNSVVANIILKKQAQTVGLIQSTNNYGPNGRFDPSIRIEGSRREDNKITDASLVIYTFWIDPFGYGPNLTVNPDGDVLKYGQTDLRTFTQGVLFKLGRQTDVKGGELKLRFNSRINRNSSVTIDTFYPPAAEQITDYTLENIQGELSASYDHALGDKASYQLLALQTLRKTEAFTTFDSASLDTTSFESRLYGESIARAALQFRPAANLTLSAEVNGAYNFLNGSSAYTENGVPIAIPSANVLVEEQRAEVAASAIWKPYTGWTLEAGARVEASMISQSGDVSSSEFFIYPKPRLVVSWAPTVSTLLKLRLEREVSQLNFDDFAASAALDGGGVNAGNAGIRPDRSWVWEARVEQQFWDKGALAVSYKHAEITDVIDLIPIKGRFDAPGNIGDGASDSLSVNLNLPLDRFGVRNGLFKAATAWNWSAVTDPVTGEERRISSQAPVSGEISFRQDLPAWDAAYGFTAALGYSDVSYRLNEVRFYHYGTVINPYVEFKT
ncbi:MAG: TonB-dependent receptor plug domain-containing protein, partial [Caulobacteraceae bacterium]